MVNKSRFWKFRLAAVLMGILPWCVAEFVLRALERPIAPTSDPYVNLQNLKPLFQPAANPEFLEIGPDRLNLFCAASFRKAKPSGTYRVFALGGSTTYGEPYRSETAFPKWLELNLQAAAPNGNVEVINCGGLSYASYRVLVILREVLQYEPDLIVVYTGHNEYLEQRTYHALPANESLLDRTAEAARRLRTVQYIRSTFSNAPANSVTRDRDTDKPRTEMLAEVDALLDYSGGLEFYHRNAVWRKPVVEHFSWNLQQMCLACQAAKVPLVLVQPVSNLLDCPPLKIESDPQLTVSDQTQFVSLWEESRATEDRAHAIALLEQALQIDPQHAGANYLLGKLDVARREFARAQHYLTLAKDWDACPLRATSEIQQAVADCAATSRTPTIDAQQLFSELSDQGIVGNRWLVDHIHPSVEGHQKLGEALAEKLEEQGIGKFANPQWRETRRDLYQVHLETLGEAYYQRGKQRLEGLLLWTQGRAKKVRSSTEMHPD